MEQLIFLDTSIIYRLSFIDKHNDLTDEQISGILQSGRGETSMRNSSIAVKKVIQLYHDIKDGKVKPCVCPTVYSEVLNISRFQKRDIERKKTEMQMQGNEYKDEKTIKDFMYEHCTLYMPSPEFKKDYIYHIYDLQEKLKQNSVQIGEYFYGLNDEAGYDGKSHSDFDDRVILSELTTISQYSNEKISVVNLQTLANEEEILKYINKLRGDISNKKKGTYENYPSAKEVIYYHFNHVDYGTRVKDDAFTDQAHKMATELENGIEQQLVNSNLNTNLKVSVRQISEYEQ